MIMIFVGFEWDRTGCYVTERITRRQLRGPDCNKKRVIRAENESADRRLGGEVT